MPTLGEVFANAVPPPAILPDESDLPVVEPRSLLAGVAGKPRKDVPLGAVFVEALSLGDVLQSVRFGVANGDFRASR